MAGRRCPGRDERDGRTVACPTILTQGERYCPRHARTYEQRRGSRRERGYDNEHERLRAMWQARINRGEIVRCWSCGTRLAGRSWHLDHTSDRQAYRGPACIPCNTGDGGRRGAAISNTSR